MTKFSQPSKFFGLVLTLGLKAVKLRYRNSFLGFIWSMMNPLIYLLIFSFVFSRVFDDIERYPLYALTGLICWVFFSTTTIQVIESIIHSAGVLKSINIPTIAFPLAAQLASLISLFLSMIPFMILMIFFGMEIGWETLLFFPILLAFACFTFGLSLILTSFNVYFRDMQLAWNSFMPAIFYATPIAYNANLVPQEYLWIIKLNPLFHFVSAFRDIFYFNLVPSFRETATMLLLGTISLAAGLLIFRKLEKGFVSQY